jgi:hypothetical protein
MFVLHKAQFYHNSGFFSINVEKPYFISLIVFDSYDK